ncbi:hypothetical protein [Trabulsiella odontotermitis]|uniref:hypothetical protein n=1 Tax=Trabulsiella odontotermitis TaxID=379893 RepID=UPI000675CD0A|nr:hypothetical protein [Trabulsiella odontotermitis]KNC91201.1 hypothetical protein GM30_23775 [Trabulsiella odontotermitis]
MDIGNYDHMMLMDNYAMINWSGLYGQEMYDFIFSVKRGGIKVIDIKLNDCDIGIEYNKFTLYNDNWESPLVFSFDVEEQKLSSPEGLVTECTNNVNGFDLTEVLSFIKENRCILTRLVK